MLSPAPKLTPTDDAFHPPLRFRSPHFQTMGSVLIPREFTAFPSEDRQFKLSDGSILVAECTWQKEPRYCMTLLVVHGLNGSTVSSYMRGIASKAYKQGFNVIRLNMRNGGRNEVLSNTLCHAGVSKDVYEVVEELTKKDKLENLGIIAFSYSGNICLKAVAEYGAKTPKALKGIVGICPLVDLNSVTERLDHISPFVYRFQFLRGLKAMIQRREKQFPGSYPVKKIKKLWKVRAFDEEYSKLCGFKNADDYYAKASALPLLKNIEIPTWIIQSKDDPVIDYRALENIDNKNIAITLTEFGGHAGYISEDKKHHPDLHWVEDVAIDFFAPKLPIR